MSAVAVKLLILTVKTISKPFSKRLKDAARNSTSFKSTCIFVGNYVNSFTHNVNIRLIGGKQIKLKPLGEPEAISKGAEVVGEGFVYAVSLTLLVGEYARRDYIKDIESKEKAEKKAKRRVEKDAVLADKFDRLIKVLAVLSAKVERLEEHQQQQQQQQQTRQQRAAVANGNPVAVGLAATSGATKRKQDNNEESEAIDTKNGTSSSWASWTSSWYWPFYVEIVEGPSAEDYSLSDLSIVPSLDSGVSE
jgi:hypothetical protein